MEINIKYLSIQNPWWSGGVLKYDPILENFDQQELKFRSELIGQIDLEKKLIYVLRGPRGCGKTIILKSLIRELIERRGINPENILYYSCHNINSNEQLNEIIKVFLAYAQERKNKDRLYIFIDEITLVKNWEKGIEYLRSAGLFGNAELFLSGSMLSGEKILHEYLKNKIYKEILIPTITFGQFVELLNPDLSDRLNAESFTQELLDKLEYYLEIYFLTGGFMAAINNYKNFGSVKQPVYSNFIYWLIADIAKMGRDLVMFRQMLERVIFNLGKPLGYKTIAHSTKAKTHLTAEEYIKILEKMFVLHVVYQTDGEKSAKSKAKKIFFLDPFLFWTMYSYIYGSLSYWQFSRISLYQEEVFVHLVENIIFCHLYKNKLEGKIKEITFWRDSIKKKEIDFIVRKDKKTIPIIVSYNDNDKEADIAALRLANFSEGIIVSKNILKLDGKFKIMPLSYFLLFFNKPKK